MLRYRYIFILVGASFSMWIGSLKIWLPQCADLIFLAMLFMEGGFQLKRHEKEISDISMEITGVISFLIWIYLAWSKNVYIEMATRQYPHSTLCILVAFLGCLSIVQFSKSIEGICFSKVISFLGKHSLDLLCIHHLDNYLEFIWNSILLKPEEQHVFANDVVKSVIRILVDLTILGLWVPAKYIVINKIRPGYYIRGWEKACDRRKDYRHN